MKYECSNLFCSGDISWKYPKVMDVTAKFKSFFFFLNISHVISDCFLFGIKVKKKSDTGFQ